MCLVLSPGAAAPLASGALQTLPWFGGEAAELRKQQGLSSWQNRGAQREEIRPAERSHLCGQDCGLEAWGLRDEAVQAQAAPKSLRTTRGTRCRVTGAPATSPPRLLQEPGPF